MGARISKFPPLSGLSGDIHLAAPPTVPPIPPPPAVPLPVPTTMWVATACSLLSGVALTGKWSIRVMTEGLGDILWTHDWGPGQLHLPVIPVTGATNIPIVIIKSSTKYFLPSFSVKQPVDGSIASSSGTPVAVSTPAFVICTQNCQDWFPSLASVCFQLVSTRWVGFTMGDFLAGMIGVVGDSLKSIIGAKLGDMIPGDGLLSALGNALIEPLTDRLVSVLPDDMQKPARYLVGAFALGLGSTAGLGSMLGYGVSDLAGAGGDAVGNSIGSQPPAASTPAAASTPGTS